jgi:hypothetical protein
MAHRLFFYDEEVGQIAQPVQMTVFKDEDGLRPVLLDAFGSPMPRSKRRHPIGFDLSRSDDR